MECFVERPVAEEVKIDIISSDADRKHEQYAHACRTDLADTLDFHFRFAP